MIQLSLDSIHYTISFEEETSLGWGTEKVAQCLSCYYFV